MLLYIHFLFLIIGASSINSLHADEIKWTDRQKLLFEDFKATTPSETDWAALTSSYIYFRYGTTNGSLSSFSVYASFRKNESWIKIRTQEVLQHEQLHFDITEVFARKLYQEARTLKNQTADVPGAASKLFKRINIECDDMQTMYDEETDHGTDETQQKKWAEKVAMMLENYESYAD